MQCFLDYVKTVVGVSLLAITQQRFEQIKRELDKKKEIVPATYDGVFKAIMDKCLKFRADLTSRIIGIPKELILNTYQEKNTEYKIDNALEKGKVSDVLFGIDGYVINYEFNGRKWDGLIERNDAYLGKIKNDLLRKTESYNKLPKVIQININNFHCFLSEDNLIEFKSRDKYGIIESDKWGKFYINLKLIREKYKRGLTLNKLEKELLILTLKKISEIEKIAKGDEELMEVANELKNLTYDINTIGLYDEEEERRRIENTKLITAEEKGIEQGASNEKKSIAKSMLAKKMDIPLISELTGLSKKQIARLM